MVAAVVPELQLVGLAAQRDSDQLMAEADAEDGDLAHHAADVLLCVGHRLGIAGAVGEEDTVGLHGQHIFGAGGCGNDGHATRFANQAAKDVLLDAVVVGHHAVLGCAIFHAHDLGRLVGAHAFVPLIDTGRGDLLGQVSAVHLGYRARLGDQLFGVKLKGGYDTTHHAMGAEMTHESAGVDFGKHGDFVALEVLLCDLLRAPVGANAGELADNQALDIRSGRLIVVGVGAVVADLGVGENYDLAGVGGIGEDFLIAGDGSIKNDFAVTFAFGAEAFAAEDSTVFQRKDCLHRNSGEWILTILSGIEALDKRPVEEINRIDFRRVLAEALLPAVRPLPSAPPELLIVALMQFAQLGERPIAEDSLAINVAPVNWAKVSAVIRQVTVVAQDKVFMRRHDNIRIRADVFVHLRHILFAQLTIVDVHQSVLDPHAIARYSNYALDVALRSVARITEDHHVTPLDRFQTVNKLVDEDPLLVFQRRHHAGSLHLHRLVEENDEERRNGQRNEDVAYPPG